MKGGIIQMCINLGRVQAAVSQDLLKGPGIYSIFQHQRGSGVPELMGRITAAVQPG